MKRLLIVDDNEQNRYLLEVLLKGNGYLVQTAVNGAEAMQRARRQLPDLIITDILMPVMDGFQLCRQWKQDQTLKKIPLIFYTATYTDDKDEALALDLGADKFIRKPADPDDFMAAVHHLIRNSATRASAPCETQDLDENGASQLYSERLVNKLEKKMLDLENEVSARRQAEMALRRSQQRLKMALKAGRMGIWEWDLSANEFHWSEEVEEIFGLQPGDFGGNYEDFLGLVHPEDRSMVAQTITETIENAGGAGQQYFAFSHRLDRPKEHTQWVENRGCILCDPSGRPAQMLGATMGISDHKKAQEERLRLATAVEQAAESIIMTDRGGNIDYVNGVFERISGFKREDILGKNFRMFKSDHHDEAFYQDMWQTISSGRVWSGRVTNHLREGKVRQFETTIYPIRDDFDQIVNFVSINHDVTQEVTLEARLRQSQKMEAIGSLAGGIAHDFNNILSAVTGYTELSLMESSEGTLLQANLQEVLRAALRATDLVKQILAFSRQSEQALKPIQLAPIVKEALQLLRSTLPATIDIHHHIENNLKNVLADATQVHQIIMNLCTNAAHAMRKTGGMLKFTLSDVDLDADFTAFRPDLNPGPHIRLTVSDTGHGMTPAILAAIFNPYFTTKEKGEGTGLGLAVVHGIARSYGGDITCYSEPGQGSTFHVYLPAIETRPSAGQETLKPLPVGHERILFVDDEPALTEMNKQRLEALGYAVDTKTSSLEALEAFKQRPDAFDLVITDMTMPNMTGDIFAEKIIALRPQIPIIMATGFSEQVSERQALDLGIKAFLMKPTILRDLAETVRRVLDETLQSNRFSSEAGKRR